MWNRIAIRTVRLRAQIKLKLSIAMLTAKGKIWSAICQVNMIKCWTILLHLHTFIIIKKMIIVIVYLFV